MVILAQLHFTVLGDIISPKVVWVSPPAILQEIWETRVFEEIMEITFPIPSAPSVPAIWNPNCEIHPQPALCQKYFGSIFDLNQATRNQIALMMKIFSPSAIVSSEHNSNQLKADQVQHLIGPNVNRQWLEKWQGALGGGVLPKKARSKRSTGNTTKSSLPNIQNLALPLSPFKPLLMMPGLKNLYLEGGKQILKILSQKTWSLPKTFLSFMDAPEKAPELVALEQASKKSLEQTVVHPTSPEFVKFFDDKSALNFSPAYMFHILQKQSAELLSASTSGNIYSHVHLSCLMGKIPIQLVPPQVLEYRMEKLEKTLAQSNSTYQLVITAKEHLFLYDLKVAECKVSKAGGFIGVQIHLKTKGSDYKLYSFKSYAFAINDNSCEIGVPSTYVVMDQPSNSVFTVSTLDAQTCSPKTSTLCKLPSVSAFFKICY